MLLLDLLCFPILLPYRGCVSMCGAGPMVLAIMLCCLCMLYMLYTGVLEHINVLLSSILHLQPLPWAFVSGYHMYYR